MDRVHFYKPGACTGPKNWVWSFYGSHLLYWCIDICNVNASTIRIAELISSSAPHHRTPLWLATSHKDRRSRDKTKYCKTHQCLHSLVLTAIFYVVDFPTTTNVHTKSQHLLNWFTINYNTFNSTYLSPSPSPSPFLLPLSSFSLPPPLSCHFNDHFFQVDLGWPVSERLHSGFYWS